ncbi:alpha/beta hydrolase [Brucella sp. 22210]|uniref:alpha/beta hydrolase n=1 Tax=Brucella sp. 22210 TaxID=3453892 RepID=UPI003F85A4C1
MKQLAFASAVGLATTLCNPASAEIQRQDFRVTAAPGIEIAVREVRETRTEANKPPVILLHGARVPGIAFFDLPVEGGSLAADLARAGHLVFVMDASGYGGSSRPGQDGDNKGLPLSSSFEVVRDILAVNDSVTFRTGARQIALLGWATGGHWAGMYASLYPGRVSHLVMLNSLYGATSGHPTLGSTGENADPSDHGRFNVDKFGAFRLNTAGSLMSAWDKSIPFDDKSIWRDPTVAAAYQEAALASDPTSSSRTPPAFRAPSGAMEDSFYLANGRQLWDAASITARVLIIRSENDFWSRPADATSLAERLVRAKDVQSVTIPEATHFVHLDRGDKGRNAFLAEVERFLSATDPQ